jgi:hypothetical protein
MLGANNVFDKKPRIIYDTASTFGGTTSSSVDSELPVDRFVYVRYNQKFRSGLQPNKQCPPGEPGGHCSSAGARGRKKIRRERRIFRMTPPLRQVRTRNAR